MFLDAVTKLVHFLNSVLCNCTLQCCLTYVLKSVLGKQKIIIHSHYFVVTDRSDRSTTAPWPIVL